MKKTDTNWAQLLHRGRYSEIVSALVDQLGIRLTTEAENIAAIGALSFLGRVQEAKSLLQQCETQISEPAQIEARFYLAVALRRHHRLTEARSLLVRNLRSFRSRRELLDDQSVFFVYQGIGFYRYAEGRMRRAMVWAERAYDAAFRAGFLYGRTLALDLKAHSQLNLGQSFAGFRNLEAAAKLAETIGSGSVSQATDATMALYRASLGFGGPKCLEDLDAAIKRCEFDDSYTLSSLYLERSKLCQLMGKLSDARRAVEDASHLVYRLDHPILDAQLCLRMASISTLSGDHAQALSLVRNARRRLAATNDLVSESHAVGLEFSLLTRLGQNSEAEALIPTIRKLAQRSGASLPIRQACRIPQCLPPNSDFYRRGEDPLGDLIDDVQSAKSFKLSEIIQSGFLGILPPVLGLSPDIRAVVIGLSGESVTVFDRGDIRHDAGGWPELAMRLLLHLAQGESSKEDIVRVVWGQRYSPLRHDPLIYALVARVRRLLEPQDAWLEASVFGYRLASGVSVSRYWPSVETAPAPNFSNLPSELRVRQAEILRLCERSGTVTNRQICELFKVSEVTATRDLTELVQKNLLFRCGRGRSTSYAIVVKNLSSVESASESRLPN